MKKLSQAKNSEKDKKKMKFLKRLQNEKQ